MDIRQLSLREKAALLSGGTVWETRALPKHGIPSIFMSDGPHGVRKQLGSSDHLGIAASEPATCFPPAATIANSWDVGLARLIGEALGTEARSQAVNVLLGPGLNIKRSPLGGRNFEYFSEDPLLSGQLAAAYVQGIQSRGVAATPKHFAVNSQESLRMVIDSVVDQRTLREIYLRAFEITVRTARPWALMSSYNRINGTYANEHSELLTDILRKEWGFDGAVITDWGGGNDAVSGVAAGSTIEMPSPGFDSARQIVAAVESGKLAEEHVDARVREVLALISRTARAPGDIDTAGHRQLARRAAGESIVLLRNEGRILPLEAGHHVAVIGDFARTPRYQGAGSSQINPRHVGTALDALEGTDLHCVGFAAGFDRSGADSEALTADAVTLARTASTVLLYLGLPEAAESEGVDREHLRLPANQIALLAALREVTDRIVVVLSAGSPVEMPWLAQTAGLVHGYLGGEAGAEAVLDVVTGAVNPSGRLAETYPVSLADHPISDSFPSLGAAAEHREGLYVGYRYFSSAQVPVAFPFGFGLSYTTFAYKSLEVVAGVAIVEIENFGAVAGTETVQLYVGRPSGHGIHRPRRELRAFAKVRLEPGETAKVRIPLEQEFFRHFDAESDRWQIETGSYPVEIGANVEDIRLTSTVHVVGTVDPQRDPAILGAYRDANVRDVPDSVYRALLGGQLPTTKANTDTLDINDPLSAMSAAQSPIARLVARELEKRRHKAQAQGAPDLNILFLTSMPFRAIAKMTNGLVSIQMVEGMLQFVNGQHIRGLARTASAGIRNLVANRRFPREPATELAPSSPRKAQS